MLSLTEENYLKTLLQLTLMQEAKEAGTNELAQALAVKPATVSDMLKKLKEKALVDYERYGKIRLTAAGKKQALQIVRRHRLWETFLFEKLNFGWEEVHEVAEQLEHIQSPLLIERLDAFLGFPQYDPHGDPIPTQKGELKALHKAVLADMPEGKECVISGVKDDSRAFLQHLKKLGLSLHDAIRVRAVQDYDGTMTIEVKGKKIAVSFKAAQNIYVD